jgi:death-on-curing protein
MNGVDYLELEEVLELQFDQIERFGGQHGVRDSGLVASAVERPRNKAAYEDADLMAQAAALLFGLAKNHGFIDGNKRIAAAGTLVFLIMNGVRLTCDSDTLASFIERRSDPDWSEELVDAFLRRWAIAG